MALKPTCHDCGCAPSMQHREGCDVERCSVCGGQRLSCSCAGHDPQLVKWNGEMPPGARGIAENAKEKAEAVLVLLDKAGHGTGGKLRDDLRAHIVEILVSL